MQAGASDQDSRRTVERQRRPHGKIRRSSCQVGDCRDAPAARALFGAVSPRFRCGPARILPAHQPRLPGPSQRTACVESTGRVAGIATDEWHVARGGGAGIGSENWCVGISHEPGNHQRGDAADCGAGGRSAARRDSRPRGGLADCQPAHDCVFRGNGDRLVSGLHLGPGAHRCLVDGDRARIPGFLPRSRHRAYGEKSERRAAIRNGR